MPVEQSAIEQRMQLMQLVHNDLTAYGSAQDFVADDPNKYKVLQVAIAEKRQSDLSVQEWATAAVMVATQRWAVINKE